MKRLLTFILLIHAFVFSAIAATVEIDNISYSLNKTTCEAEVVYNSYHVYAGDIVIPETVVYEGTEYQVTSIREQAFFCCASVSSITFPNSITTIGRSTFWGCHALNSVAIPEKVTIIEDNLFADCQGLRHVDIPDGVSHIGNSAFNSCVSLDSMLLPDAVEAIDDWAFSGCRNLSHIVIPKSLKEVGRGNFADCPSLNSVLIQDLSAWCAINFADAQANPLYTSGKLIIDGEEITDLVIPDDVTNIGSCAFWPCANLTSITIGEHVSSIGSYAFNRCSKLTSVVCYPRRVPRTGSYPFNFSNDALENCKLYVPGCALSEYQNTEPWKNFQEILCLDIPKHQLSYYIDDQLYKSFLLEEGEYITPEPPAEKEGYTFSGWSEIPETMPDHDVTVTGSFTLTSQKLLLDGVSYTLWVLSKTAELSSATISDISSFSGHISIPAIVSKDGVDYTVTTIGDWAFKECTGLTSVIIPESVVVIGRGAFTACMLENIFMKNVNTQFYENSFSQPSYNHAMLYIPLDKWQEAVYQGCMWRFINIRETATTVNDLSSEQAYTMMDSESFGYVVYDSVNDVIRIISAYYNVDESNPNNCWQIVNLNGEYCIYNIGAKKYAQQAADGTISLTAIPTSYYMEDGESGIVIDNNAQRQWNFVLNNKVSADQDITGIQLVTNSMSDTDNKYYLPNGLEVTNPQRGIVIVKLKDGSTKKIIR